MARINIARVDEDGATVGSAQPAEGDEQRRLAGAAGTDDAHEARGGNGQRDVIEDGQRAGPHDQMIRANGAAGGVGDAIERVAVELKAKRTHLETVTDRQFVGIETMAVHEGAGGAVEVRDDDASALPRRGRSVASGNAGIVEHHLEAWLPAESQRAVDFDAVAGFAKHQHLQTRQLRMRFFLGKGGIRSLSQPGKHDDRRADSDLIAGPGAGSCVN